MSQLIHWARISLALCLVLWAWVWWEWLPHGVWERYLGCPVSGPTPTETRFVRLRVDKPGYYFLWIVLRPQGCHVQGKHLTCTHGRVSILVLAFWGKAMCLAGKLRFQRGVCTRIWPEVTDRIACQSLKHWPKPRSRCHRDQCSWILSKNIPLSPHQISFSYCGCRRTAPSFRAVVWLHKMQIISSLFLAFYFCTVFVLFWDGGQQQLVFLQTRIYKSLKYDLDSEYIRTDWRNKWERKKVSESEISSFCKLPCDYAKLFSYVFCQT